MKTAIEAVSKNCGYKEFFSEEVACEKYQDSDNYDTCLMTNQTEISFTNFIIANLKDEEIEGIKFEGNKNIRFLPYKIYLQFPNLVIYNAERCSIKQISMQNFENLRSLKSIELRFNRIKKISGDTFKGLDNLRSVDLSKFNLHRHHTIYLY